MRRFLLLILIPLFVNGACAQSLKKYTIGKSGCAAFFYCNPGKFDESKSPDSSDVYTAECQVADVGYGLICVKLKDKITDLEAGEGVLVQYLDYLKGTLNITSAAGYGKGHKLKGKEATRGIIDYWKDKEDINWKVKGWTDGKYIAVLYVYGKSEVNEAKANVYLDGLVLP